MRSAIEKLIDEYDLKISDNNKILSSLEQRKSELRNLICDSMLQKQEKDSELASISKTEIRLVARNSCYVQTKYDFDSLIDVLCKLEGY